MRRLSNLLVIDLGQNGRDHGWNQSTPAILEPVVVDRAQAEGDRRKVGPTELALPMQFDN